MFRYIALIVLPSLVLSCCPPKQWNGDLFVDYAIQGADGQGYRSEVIIAFIEILIKINHFC